MKNLMTLREMKVLTLQTLKCCLLRRRVIDSDDSDDDGFVVVQYESVAGESGDRDRDKGSMACGSNSNHKAEKIVIILRKNDCIKDK